MNHPIVSHEEWLAAAGGGEARSTPNPSFSRRHQGVSAPPDHLPLVDKATGRRCARDSTSGCSTRLHGFMWVHAAERRGLNSVLAPQFHPW